MTLGRKTLESPGSGLCVTVGRKPATGTRVGIAASFHGSNDRQQLSAFVQRWHQSTYRRTRRVSRCVIGHSSKTNRGSCSKHRLPAIYPRVDFAVSGDLMSYGPVRGESFKRAAWMIDEILKGARPADIRVEQPMKFELLII